MMTHEEMIAVIRAHKDGKEIQVKGGTLLNWREYPYRDFFPNFESYIYRVKPQPREWHGEVLPSGGLYIHDQPNSLTRGGELIKVREVI